MSCDATVARLLLRKLCSGDKKDSTQSTTPSARKRYQFITSGTNLLMLQGLLTTRLLGLSGCTESSFRNLRKFVHVDTLESAFGEGHPPFILAWDPNTVSRPDETGTGLVVGIQNQLLRICYLRPNTTSPTGFLRASRECWRCRLHGWRTLPWLGLAVVGAGGWQTSPTAL